MNLLDLLFPRRCVGCGRIGGYFCATCRRSIRIVASNEMICPVCEGLAIDGITHPACRTRYSPDGLTSFFRYDGIVRTAVKTLKYRLVSDLAGEFVFLIPPVTVADLSRIISSRHVRSFVPVPLHVSRLYERGFNQAEVLGVAVSIRLQLPVRTDMLRRTRRTVPQVEKSNRQERLKHMEGVFAAQSVTDGDSGVVLFDDVFTTGATIRSAANVLKRAGVRFVWAVTMAR